MSDDNDLQSDIAGNSPDFNDRSPKGGLLGWLRGRRGGDDVYTSGRVHTGGRDGNGVRGGLSRRIGPFEYARTARGGVIQTSPDGAQILRAGGRIGGLVEGLTNLFGGGRGRDGGDSRRSDPEFRAIQEERQERQMRQRGETSQDRSAPRVTQRPATPQELEGGQSAPAEPGYEARTAFRNSMSPQQRDALNELNQARDGYVYATQNDIKNLENRFDTMLSPEQRRMKDAAEAERKSGSGQTQQQGTKVTSVVTSMDNAVSNFLNDGPNVKAFEDSLTPEQKKLRNQAAQSSAADWQHQTAQYAPGTLLGLARKDSDATRQLNDKFEQSLTLQQRDLLAKADLEKKEATASRQQYLQENIEGRIRKDVTEASKVTTAEIKAGQEPTVKIPTGDGAVVTVDKNTTRATFSPPPKDPSGFDVKEYVGKTVDTALLNQLSNKGISFEQRIGQGGEAINILTTKEGKIIAGYKGDAEGKQTIISRDDLSTRLADVGKDLNQFEKQFQVVHAELNEKLQNALKPTTLEGVKMADNPAGQAITAKPPILSA